MPQNELLILLEQAATMVEGTPKLNWYCGHDTGEEFAAELRSLRDRVARRDRSALEKLRSIFSPTCAWDNAGCGEEGCDLANKIWAALPFA